MRRLAFNDDLFAKLHGYQLDAAPTIDLAMSWFPGAHLTRGAGAHIGLSFRGSFAMVFSSRTRDGPLLSTSAYGLDTGLVGRIPIGRVVQPELAVAYGRQVYEVGGTLATGEKPTIPSVTYGFVRFGAGLRLRAGERVAIDGHFGYRLLVGTGELGATYFPRARVDAIDGDATLTIAIARGFEARVGGAVQHYFATLNPEPGAPIVAGGLTDTYVTGTLMLAYRLSCLSECRDEAGRTDRDAWAQGVAALERARRAAPQDPARDQRDDAGDGDDGSGGDGDVSDREIDERAAKRRVARVDDGDGADAPSATSCTGPSGSGTAHGVSQSAIGAPIPIGGLSAIRVGAPDERSSTIPVPGGIAGGVSVGVCARVCGEATSTAATVSGATSRSIMLDRIPPAVVARRERRHGHAAVFGGRSARARLDSRLKKPSVWKLFSRPRSS
jgi:hypothetical protein